MFKYADARTRVATLVGGTLHCGLDESGGNEAITHMRIEVLRCWKDVNSLCLLLCIRALISV